MIMRVVLGASTSLAVLLAALTPTPVAAGPYTVAFQTPTYSPGPGGGVSPTPRASIPAYSYMPADVPDNFTTNDWLNTGGAAGGQFCPHNPALPFDQVTNCESRKARFDCSPEQKSFQADSILFPYQNNVGHRHRGFGNTEATANPTLVDYTWLRANGSARCFGGKVNRSFYWEPDMLVEVDGLLMGLIPINVVTYYEGGEWGPPRGIDLIFGRNPADMEENTAPTSKAALKAAAAAGGVDGDIQDGFGGWACGTIGAGGTGLTAWSVGSGRQPYLVDENGNPTLNCGVNGQVVSQLGSPDCWDAVNFTSPDGRSHMARTLRVYGTFEPRCPDSYVNITSFQAHTYFRFANVEEMKKAHLSSDRMNPPGTPPDPTSSSPCRRVGPWYCPGETMHADVKLAWSWSIFKRFITSCSGAKYVGIPGEADMLPDPHECGYGRIDATAQAKVEDTPSPDGSLPSPFVVLDLELTGSDRFDVAAGASATGITSHDHGYIP